MISSLVLALLLTQNAPPPPPQQLRWDPRIDIPVTGALAAGWIISDAFKKDLAPQQCRLCGTNGFDNAIRVLFNPSLKPSADGFHGADTASTIVGFIAVPVAMIGLDAIFTAREGVFMKAFWTDVVLMLEATFSALAVNQTVKFLAGRARPYTIGAPPELLESGRDPPDNNLSFFSGHTTLAFALTSSAATIASLRGYRHAWVLWAVGLPLATATGILRLAADKHWASDVLVGAAVGTVFGVLMPTLLHGRVGPIEAQVAPMPNGISVSGRF